MSLAERDPVHTPPPHEPKTNWVALVAIAAVVGGVLAVAWLRSDGSPDAAVGVRPSVTYRSVQIPQPNDPWASFLAPEHVCPGRADGGAAAEAQQRTVVCLLDYARARQGLAPLAHSEEVSQWSALKARAIARCRMFSHMPCGGRADGYARSAGFTGSFGENLFLGPGPYKTPLAAVDGWLNSPSHRENLFRPGWRKQGIAVLHDDEFGGQQDVAIWVSEFAG